MATYNKFQSWVEYLAEGVNCGSDVFKVALTNTLPVNTNTILTDITQCSGCPANLDTVTLTTATSAQTSGTFKLDFNDLTMTASGSVGAFRYVVIYDDTVANDPLVCWFDYGSSITLASGETFKLTFDAAGLFTVA